MLLSRLRFSVVMLLVVLVAGCSGSGRLRYDTPKEAFDKGMERYESGKYARAVQYFQGSFDFGRTHEWADDAQLFLARAYRANKEYILAANEYSRFAQIYRADPRVPEAEFERAMTFYERSPLYQLDQTNTEDAINAFNLFINRYPTHESVLEAEQRIKELREKLAHKQYDTALQYEQRELFQAAALSYEVVFDKYSDTDWADDALLGAIRTYIIYSDESVEARQAERLQKAVDHYQRLLQLFPDSELLKDAEALYEQATSRMQALAGGRQ
ncbi:MAG: outer membrane protein assembly factor BamD [Rhodothermales bacterium]